MRAPRVLRTVRGRIFAAFVLTLLAFTGALGTGLLQLRDIGQGLRALDTGYLPLARTAAQIEAIARQLDRDHDRFARGAPQPIAGRRSMTVFFSTSLADAVNTGQAAIERAAGEVDRTEDRDALAAMAESLARIDEQRRAYDDAVENWLDSVAEDSSTGADSGRALAELDARRTELVLEAGALTSSVEARIQRTSQRTSAAQNRAFVVSGALAGLALFLAGLMGLVSLLTLRPIGALTQQVQRLAAGEGSARVDVTSGDELGLLAREFNAMADAVAERDRRLSERAAALDALSHRLRRVLDTIQAGLVVVDGGRVTMANPAAEQLWGAREGDVLPEDLSALDPGSYEAHPLGARRVDVDIVPFEESGLLVVGEDVTQRLRVRERLARSERLALVGQMLAQITHEVRNPLNAMSLNAELLADELEDVEAREMIGIITAEIRRLEAVTARYLDLSRRRRPALSFEEPGPLVRTVLRLEEEALRRAGVQVAFTTAELPEVEMDGEALRRALRNVVRNAVEAGAQELAIDVGRDLDTLRVSVVDDGPGMSAEQVSRAFEAFFTTKARGTGLGLAISRQELEEVGGSLECTSAPGSGTTFTIRLPLQVSDHTREV